MEPLRKVSRTKRYACQVAEPAKGWVCVGAVGRARGANVNRSRWWVSRRYVKGSGVGVTRTARVLGRLRVKSRAAGKVSRGTNQHGAAPAGMQVNGNWERTVGSVRLNLCYVKGRTKRCVVRSSQRTVQRLSLSGMSAGQQHAVVAR